MAKHPKGTRSTDSARNGIGKMMAKEIREPEPPESVLQNTPGPTMRAKAERMLDAVTRYRLWVGRQ